LKIEIKLETLSGHAKDGTCCSLNKKAGDSISAGDIIAEIETGKGVAEIASDATGTVISINIAEGDKIALGNLIAVIDGERADSKTPDKTDDTFTYSFGPSKPVDRTLSCDIAIIGGGPGGYVAAIKAAQLGATVILVERDALGGTCLNRGCIPTKSLIRSAEVYKDIKNAEHFGLGAGHYPADISQIVRRKDDIVKQLVQGIGYLLENNKVTVLKGEGIIDSAKLVKVAERNYNTSIEAENIILATGSTSCSLTIPGMESDNVMTSTEALSLSELPRRMAIIGGGIIGMEFAFLFSSLGVEVSVIEYFENILNVFDNDIIDAITESAKEAGIKLITGASVKSILENESGGSIIKYDLGGSERYDLFEKVLVAVGRKPCFDGLNLEKLGVNLTENKRGIEVDSRLKTTAQNIYAIGDITNKIQLAHVASHQGIVAVNNIMNVDSEMDYSVVPSAVFTFPEFATIGVSEKEAAEKNIDIKIGKFPFAANGKSLTLGESAGFVKIITDKETDVVIGGAIAGPHATDLIAEITLAVKKGLTAEDIAETIHAHPTSAEAIHEAALAAGPGSLHF